MSFQNSTVVIEVIRRSVTVTVLAISIAATFACAKPDTARPDDRPPLKSIRLEIQPYKGFADEDLEVVKRGINELYRLDVEILRERDLPTQAYYEPRNRYLADRLLADLQTHGADTTKSLGLTHLDISVMRGENENWGIFGFGMIGGKPSVVSSYRLRGTNRTQYESRLQKVVNHEIGHTLGLDHCDQDKCLMQDAKGTISTVDNSSGKFCPRCVADLARLSVLNAQ